MNFNKYKKLFCHFYSLLFLTISLIIDLKAKLLYYTISFILNTNSTHTSTHYTDKLFII